MKRNFIRLRRSLGFSFQLILLAMPFLANALPNEKMSLEQAIQEISARYDVYFTYNKSLVQEITVDFELSVQTSLEEVMEDVLEGTMLQYRIHDNKYVIIYKSDREGISSLKEMAKHLDNLIGQEENRILTKDLSVQRLQSPESLSSIRLARHRMIFNVSGTVTDQDGEPLIGVNIQVKGSSKGTATDFDGRFSLEDIDENSVLVISYIGYQTQEIPVAGKSNIDVVMVPDSQLLEEVVVVGYGTQKKVNLTGAVSSVSASDIQDKPVANTASLLQGRIPGLVLTQNGAQAGNDNPEIRIRGIGTFGNNNPMVVIDGVEGSLSQISDIPAGDIDNISVLKDAASASIYGVRAANGVILITTKRGEPSDKAKISYSGSYTMQTPGITPDFVGGYDWALMRNEVRPGTFSDDALTKLRDGSDPDHYANTQWLDAVLRNAMMNQHHLSISGGSENTRYMTSVAYSNQDGIMKYTGVERISLRSNVDVTRNRFNFGLNVSGNKNDVTAPAVAPSGSEGIMRQISWYTRPTVPIQYSNGHYGYVDGSMTNAEDIKNPLELMSLGNRQNEQWRFNGNAFAGIDLMEGLNFRSSIAYLFDLNNNKTYSPMSPARYDAEGNIKKIAGETNQSSDYWYRSASWTNENILTFNRDLGFHNLRVLLGHSIIGSRYYTTTASIQGFPTENIYELNGGTINPNARGNSEEYKLQSFFGRMTYDFADRYLFEFNIRHDGSSRMPKNNRYGTFPSMSAGWVFSNEMFMSDQNIISFGKLRVSWGKLGNQEIGNYAYTATLGASGNYFFNQDADKQAGMVQTSVPNEEIKWETTRSTNIGIDLGFLDNKVQTTFELFDKKTTDILMQLAMPGIFLGSLPAPYQNVGSVLNRGWEWNLRYLDSKGDWSWEGGFNLSNVKNEILEMGGLKETISGNTVNRIGNPIGAYFGYRAIGLYRTQEDLERTNSQGEVIRQNGVYPVLGDIMYADINDDGNITADDRDIIGNPFPKYSFSFNLGASWRNIDLSSFWQGVTGIYRYNWETTTDIRGNFTSRWLDRFSENNLNGGMPALGNTMNDSYSSFWLENSKYIRLKNIELGYRIQKDQLSRLGVSQIRLYFSGINLLTFTPLENWDPEKTSGDARNDVHPNVKTYSFGVNVQF